MRQKMKDTLQIIMMEIEEGVNLLHLKAAGTVSRAPANHKLRILAVFSAKGTVRRFPMDAVCSEEGAAFSEKEGAASFVLQKDISLSDIFYPVPEQIEQQMVKTTFEYCDEKGEWISFDEELCLEGKYFLKQQEKTSGLRRFLRRVAYIGCTLLLPVWLLDGYLAVKGMKSSPYIDSEIKGKKGIFYHAQGIVKRLTGYGYSMREIKTGYFAKQYKRSCRKITEPDGVLFLSEREPDQGGNLDLIRSGVQKENLAWQEFIDTRPVHKLPFSAIRRAAWLAAGARVIVLEDFYPQIHALTLREETKLLQLWHACGAFKMFGLSDIEKVNHLQQDTKNHRSYSVTFVSGTQMIPFYSEAFGISPERVLPLGVPRTDIFFDEAYGKRVRERLYSSYPMLSGKQVVLFAPTFRGSGNKRAYYPVERFSVDSFLDAMPEDSVLVLKNHPFVKDIFSCEERHQSRVLDLTGKENINDILFITDLLITDYSSCIFEASLLAVPMLFYVFDLEEYVSGRDIYFDFASFAPGSQADSFAELIKEAEKILEKGKEADNEKRGEFCRYFLDSLDGHSTERILSYIKQLLF